MHSAHDRLVWHRPDCVNLGAVRTVFHAEVAPALEAATLDVWKEEVPISHHKQIARQIRAGLRQGLQELQYAPQSDADCWYLFKCLPRYWEPPEPDTSDTFLPPHQARAYRWTVALLAFSVRNALEDLHVRFTSDTRMPTLNRHLRNTLYSILLRNPSVIWQLSKVPRALVALTLAGIDLPIPAAAG